MVKYIQNQVAESRYLLPSVTAFAIAVWLASGQLIPTLPFTSTQLLHGAWVQFVCFLVTVYMMVELNNSYALIRIYSRTVSSLFLLLTCAGSFLFASLGGAIVQLCFVGFLFTGFHCYQDKQSAGWIYYAFICLGLASVVFVNILFFVPFLWLQMFFQLSSLSWRTFFASLIGLLTPYWFALPLLMFQGQYDWLPAHFAALAEFSYDLSQLTVNQLLLFFLVVGIGITGTVHYWRKKSGDNIRIRLFYNCFIYNWMLAAGFLILQPQHYDALIRIMIINVSPLIGHFLALTSTRTTNIAFYAIGGLIFVLTVFNLWMPSLTF